MLVRCTARHGPAVEVIRRPFQAEWAAVVLLAGSHASERRFADCVAGHIGLELQCAKRKFISLNVRQYRDLSAPEQTRQVVFRRMIFSSKLNWSNLHRSSRSPPSPAALLGLRGTFCQ